MTAVETPTGRRCPRCGSGMTEEQEWCLHCGAAVGTRVVAAQGWRAPLAVAGLIAAVAAVAVIVAIVQLADDTDRVAETPPAAVGAAPTPAATPAPTLTPDPLATTTPTPTPTPAPTTTPDPTATPEAAGGGDADWPDGESGWTVVLSSDTARDTAERKAEGFAADGIGGVGVLRSDDFSSLRPGYWVVFAGRYAGQAAASDALDGIDARDAYIRRIVPN